MMASEERLWKVFQFWSSSEYENNVEELGNTWIVKLWVYPSIVSLKSHETPAMIEQVVNLSLILVGKKETVNLK